LFSIFSVLETHTFNTHKKKEMYKIQLFSSLLLVLEIFYHICSGTSCNYIQLTEEYFPTDVCIGTYGTYSNNSVMYACSADGTYVTGSEYSDTFNCKGTPSSMINYTLETIGVSGLSCGGTNCALLVFEKYYLNNDCSGTPYDYFLNYLITNKCFSGVLSGSYMYTCSSSGYVMISYTDGSCAKKNSTFDYSGCYESYSTSVDYVVKTCGNPTTSSSPVFSAVISFVMVAIAYFGW